MARGTWGCLLIGLILVLLSERLHADPKERDHNELILLVQERLNLSQLDLEVIDLPRATGREFVTTLTLDGDPFTIHLTPYSLRSRDFELLVQGADGALKSVAASPPRTFRGSVVESDGSLVTASLGNLGMTAVIRLGDGRQWYVQPLAEILHRGAQLHIIHPAGASYFWGEELVCGVGLLGKGQGEDRNLPASISASGTRAEAVVEKPFGSMGGSHHRSVDASPSPFADRFYASMRSGDLKVAEIAFDVDADFFANLTPNDTPGDAMVFVEALLNEVDLIYTADVGICYSITTIIVRTAEPDPYNAETSGGLLTQFQDYWNLHHTFIPRDVAHLITGKPLFLFGSTGVAYVETVCNRSEAYGLSSLFHPLLTMEKVIGLVAHELGHNWSACHCDEADSGCAPQSSDPCCQILPDGECTIMCHSLVSALCSSDLSSFSAPSRESIVNYKNVVGCLGEFQPVLYVDIDAHQGGGNGTNWANAFVSLQGALTVAAKSGGQVQEIWVAAGEYRPRWYLSDDRASRFQLLDGVAIYGGFSGGEVSRNQRDWILNETILSGNLHNDFSYDDNSFHVVDASLTDSTAVLDGFTVTEGNADGTGDEAETFGGGLYIKNGNPTINNTIFRANRAAQGGGGVYIENGSPTFRSCEFNYNHGTDLSFSLGGGIKNTGDGGHPTFVDCRFRGNTAGVSGGGLFSGSPATLVNCLFRENVADFGGALSNVLVRVDAPSLINCTLTNNVARASGGGIYHFHVTTASVDLFRMANSIVWGNTDDGSSPEDPQFFCPDGCGTLQITDSCIQDWTHGGIGNIDQDPEFTGVSIGDFRPSSGSPCVDAGNAGALLGLGFSVLFDLEGNDRSIDGDGDLVSVLDMGALEYDGPAIVSQPTLPQSVCEANSVTLDVTATGSDLLYQWYKNGAILSGAVQSSLIIPSADPEDDAGAYFVVVANDRGDATSDPADLVVDPAPSPLPQQVTVCEGSPLVLAVQASGALAYQWYRDGTLLSGETGPNFSIDSVDPLFHHGDAYHVEVTFACGVVATNSSTLTVSLLPLILADPTVEPQVCEGETVILSVTAQNAATYAWYQNGSLLPGQGDSSLRIESAQLEDEGEYFVEVGNGCGTATSATVTLTLETDPPLSLWTGEVNDLFANPANWDTCVVSVHEVVLRNGGGVNDVAIIDAGTAIEVETLSLGATAPGKQTVQIDSGGSLNLSVSATIDGGGEIDLRGGELFGRIEVMSGGSLEGEGTVSGDVMNLGRVEADIPFQTLSIDGALTGSSSARLVVSNGSNLHLLRPNQTVAYLVEVTSDSQLICAETMTNEGRIEIDQSTLEVGTELINNGDLLMSGLPSTITAPDAIQNNQEICITSGFGQFYTSALQQNPGGVLNIAPGAFGFLNGSLLLPGGSVNWNTACSALRSGSGDAVLAVFGGVQAGTAGGLLLGSGTLQVVGPLDLAIDDPVRLDLSGGTVQLLGGLGGGTQEIEMLSPDWGAAAAIPSPTLFAIGTLQIGPGAVEVALVDDHENGGDGAVGGEVLYVDNLVLESGSVLDLGSSKLYYRTITPSDACSNGMITIRGDCSSQLVPVPEVIFVDDDAVPGTMDGSSWVNAFVDLQDALSMAPAGSQIWVATGVYQPDRGVDQSLLDRRATFSLRDRVAVYGGFAGWESALGQRERRFEETVLSGDLAGDDETGGSRAENSYHVVTQSGTGGTAVLDGVTIAFGNADGAFPDDRGAGLTNDAGSPTLRNCRWMRNQALFGGGLFNGTGSRATVSDSVFIENGADEGGGVWNGVGSQPTMTNCLFVGNSAAYGGAMANRGCDPELRDSTFLDNSAQLRGGGMDNSSNSAPTLRNCSFERNTALVGGGLCNRTNSGPTLRDCVFRENTASNAGGGLANEMSSHPRLVSCTFQDNSVIGNGGGVHDDDDCSPILVDCLLDGNTATGNGGGFHAALSGSPTVIRCVFSGNEVTGLDGVGGAVFLGANSIPKILNCEFFDNSSVNNHGGGIYCGTASAIVANCMFQGNSCGVQGGALYLAEGGSKLVGCTLWMNVAGETGGGLYCSADPRVENCILWRNDATQSTGEAAQISGGAPIVNYCCIEGWSGSLGGLGNFGSDPLLGEIVPGSLQLLSGSPCIDAGDNHAVPADSEDLDGDNNLLEPIGLDLAGAGRFGDDPRTTDSGQGDPPVVDLGAYEYHDCQNNGVNDAEEIFLLLADDCNENAVPDECDIQLGASRDFNGDFVPDECATVVITEILPNPRRGIESWWEFIEIKNCGCSPVSVSTLTNGSEHPLHVGNVNFQIQPGETLILTSRRAEAFVRERAGSLAMSQVITVDYLLWPRLGDETDTVRVLDDSGELLDEVRYELGGIRDHAGIGTGDSISGSSRRGAVATYHVIEPRSVSLGRSIFLRSPFVSAARNDRATPVLARGGWRWSDNDPMRVVTGGGDVGSPGTAPECDGKE